MSASGADAARAARAALEALPPVGDPYRLGLWHKDRATLRGVAFEARIPMSIPSPAPAPVRW